MKATLTTLLILAMGPILVAQTPVRNAQQPTRTQEATASAVESIELRFAVSGLTQANLVKVKEGLVALSTQLFVCEPCKVEMTTAGKCSKCGANLVAETKPLLAAVQPAPDDSSISLTLSLARLTRFSEIEAALAKNSIQVDYAKLPIVGRAQLVLHDGTLELAPAVEKALLGAKLFEEAKASFDPATRDIVVSVRSGPAPSTRAKLAAALASAGLQLRIADVFWGPVAQKI